VKTLNSFSTSIHTTLRDLIEAKSKRDGIKFTSYQLANALSMPRSIITKLTHSDESKRIFNPRIETLIKIVDFFRNDGFDITIDNLLGIKTKSIDIQSQPIILSNAKQTVELYSLGNSTQMLGTAEINITQKAENTLALYAEENIDPFFKAGTVFIIDTDMLPQHDTLIAVKSDHSEKIIIKKYLKEKNKIILQPLNSSEKSITLMPTQSCPILGVVIQINAKT
jgi:hypothetical protein